MLDEQAISLTNQFIEVEFDKRRRALRERVIAIAQEFNGRGALNSSGHVMRVIKLCEAEAEARASIIVQVHANVLTQLHIQPYPALADELKQRLRSFLPLNDDYIAVADQVEKRTGLLIPMNAPVLLATARERAIKSQDAQIDLTVLSSLRKVEKEPAGTNASITYNINAPVGAFQTGTGAIANVNQTFNAGEREALVKALELVRDAIQREEHINTFNKGEVIELIDEGKTEAEKPKPNRTKLAAIMNTVSSAIQNVEKFNSAYQTIKTALAPFGILLP